MSVARRTQDFEVVAFCEEEYPPAYNQWPEGQRKEIDELLRRQMADLPEGAVIVKTRTHAGWRNDLSGCPWQLFYSVTVELPLEKVA